jgi:hypothetical protein
MALGVLVAEVPHEQVAYIGVVAVRVVEVVPTFNTCPAVGAVIVGSGEAT